MEMFYNVQAESIKLYQISSGVPFSKSKWNLKVKILNEIQSREHQKSFKEIQSPKHNEKSMKLHDPNFLFNLQNQISNSLDFLSIIFFTYKFQSPKVTICVKNRM